MHLIMIYSMQKLIGYLLKHMAETHHVGLHVLDYVSVRVEIRV